jgi:hypothetical protein
MNTDRDIMEIVHVCIHVHARFRVHTCPCSCPRPRPSARTYPCPCPCPCSCLHLCPSPCPRLCSCPCPPSSAGYKVRILLLNRKNTMYHETPGPFYILYCWLRKHIFVKKIPFCLCKQSGGHRGFCLYSKFAMWVISSTWGARVLTPLLFSSHIFTLILERKKLLLVRREICEPKSRLHLSASDPLQRPIYNGVPPRVAEP